MNKTYKKMMARGIKGSLSRFFAIVCIVALGTGFLSGLLSTTGDMQDSADDYYRSHDAYDANVKGTLGLTQDDVDYINGLDYVRKAEGLYTTDLLVDVDDEESVETKVMGENLDKASKQGSLNRFEIVEGRMPENAKECLIEIPNQYGIKHKLGESITISRTNDDYKDVIKDFKYREYEVVGIVKSPLYVSLHGDITTVGAGTIKLGLFLSDEAYSTEVFAQCYMTFNGVRNLPSAGEEYKDKIKEYDKRLKAVGRERAGLRTEEVKAEAQKKLDKAEKKYNAGRAEARSELASAKSELDSAERKIASGQREIDRAKKELKAKKKQVNALKAQLDEMKPTVKQLEAIVEAGGKLTEEEQAFLEQYYTGMKTLKASQKAIKSAKVKIEAEQIKINEAETELARGRAEYNSAKIEAEKELERAAAKLKDGRQEIKDIENAEWYVFDRSDNPGMVGYTGDSEKIAAIAKVFPLFFFLVAVLVALTTMTRMIEEERSRVGALKSLGYNRREIRRYYLLYAFLASVTGSLIGMGLGFKVFPMVIADAYSMMYNFPRINAPIVLNTGLVIGIITVVGIMSAAYFSSRSELNEKPATLLLPKTPKPGQRILLEKITPVWRLFSFSYKVSARNLFRHKKHFLMTIIGVSGCFALLLTGIGLRDSIGAIVDRQYGEVNDYECYMELKSGVDVHDEDIIKQLNNKKLVKDWGAFCEDKITVSTDSGKKQATIMIPKHREDLTRFITLKERASGRRVAFDEDSVVITEKMSEALDVKPGDEINIKQIDGKERSFTLTGITENYISAYCYMSEGTYDKAFGESCDFSEVLIKTADGRAATEEKLVTNLLKAENVEYVIMQRTAKDTFADSVKSIDYIIVVIVFCAIALAMIVLYNMANVIICERKKELATLKVLGFYEREAKAYIFREINILSAIGMLIGVPIGIWLHNFVVKTAEVDDVMFIRSIYWDSYAIAAAVTIVVILIVNFTMRWIIRRISMVESMKAND